MLKNVVISILVIVLMATNYFWAVDRYVLHSAMCNESYKTMPRDEWLKRCGEPTPWYVRLMY